MISDKKVKISEAKKLLSKSITTRVSKTVSLFDTLITRIGSDDGKVSTQRAVRAIENCHQVESKLWLWKHAIGLTDKGGLTLFNCLSYLKSLRPFF